VGGAAVFSCKPDGRAQSPQGGGGMNFPWSIDNAWCSTLCCKNSWTGTGLPLPRAAELACSSDRSGRGILYVAPTTMFGAFGKKFKSNGSVASFGWE